MDVLGKGFVLQFSWVVDQLPQPAGQDSCFRRQSVRVFASY